MTYPSHLQFTPWPRLSIKQNLLSLQFQKSKNSCHKREARHQATAGSQELTSSVVSMKQRGQTGSGKRLWTLKVSLPWLTPIRPHLQNLPKQCHQLETTCSNIRAMRNRLLQTTTQCIHTLTCVPLQRLEGAASVVSWMGCGLLLSQVRDQSLQSRGATDMRKVMWGSRRCC